MDKSIALDEASHIMDELAIAIFRVKVEINKLKLVTSTSPSLHKAGYSVFHLLLV
jgi:hypothetical protein